jgi:putative glutamine amidotransferase
LDPVRDLFELQLLTAALERGIPVLAICRGLQLLNVSRGGTLHAHLPAHPVGGDGTHAVRFAEGSTFAALYGPVTETNSLHHQSIEALGTDLIASGWAQDGIVEAVELPGASVLGVQWHPEQLARDEPVFEWLVKAALARSAPGGQRRGTVSDSG